MYEYGFSAGYVAFEVGHQEAASARHTTRRPAPGGGAFCLLPASPVATAAPSTYEVLSKYS